jgi:molybdenum cofactor cytidylyltransferase
VGAVAIVPAAGKAQRFGGGKLTADINGEPLITHTLRSLLDGGVEQVIVVTAPDADFSMVPLLQDARIAVVVNPDPSRGMFSSIQTGVAAAAGDPILVLPADMPFIKSSTVAAVIAGALESGRTASPRYNGRHGHPVAMPAQLRDEILKAASSSTLAALLKARADEQIEIDVDDAGIRRDVDARGDLPA